jgi:outer membrane protein
MKPRKQFTQFFCSLAPKALVLACAAFLIPGQAISQTLLETYELAVKRDPKFLAAKAESSASGMAIDQARAGLLPSIMLDVEQMRTRQEVEESDNPIYGTGTAKYNTYTYTLSVSQPIFRKEAIERFQQSKSVVKQAEYTALASEQDLLMRTVSAYLIVLAAKDSLALASSERAAVGKLVEEAKVKRQSGLGTITQQHEADARYGVASAREIEAQSKLRDAYQGLREITGEYVENVQELHDDFPLEYPEPLAIGSWLETATQKNLILLARREGVNVARQEIKRKNAGHYPDLSVKVNHNFKDSGSTLYGGGSVVNTTDVMLQLRVPIYEGGAVTTATKEASYRYKKAQEEYEFEYRSLDRRTRAAFDAIVSGVSLIQALKKSVMAQQSALNAKTEGYKSGLNTILPVLDAQRDLYLARRDYAQSRYDYLVNRLRLKQSAGTLSEADLAYVASKLH